MPDPLVTIAAKLATALRNSQCGCVITGSWPRFAEVKAHPARRCQRCAALEAYDGWRAIVQTPATAPLPATKETK